MCDEHLVRWEVWISDNTWCDDVVIATASTEWRFNACFDRLYQAENERKWYTDRGYDVDIRARTTRYQRRAHMSFGRWF
jgi:hypothetical protein